MSQGGVAKQREPSSLEEIAPHPHRGIREHERATHFNNLKKGSSIERAQLKSLKQSNNPYIEFSFGGQKAQGPKKHRKVDKTPKFYSNAGKARPKK